MKISRVLHAGYIFENDGTSILFDPIFEIPFSVNCFAFPEVNFDVETIQELKFDAIFISHIHDDHCSFESLNLLHRDTPLYIYCQHERIFELLRELGFKRVHPLRLNHSVNIGSITVTPRRALDVDVDSIFQIEASGLKILNVVDSWIDEQTLDLLAQLAPWDLVLWPFQTMREIEVLAPSFATPAPAKLPEEWLTQLSVLKPVHLVPSSCQFQLEPWSWYNRAFFPISYAFFKREMTQLIPTTKVLRIEPSQTMTLTKEKMVLTGQLPWATLMGSEASDYIYEPNLKPPTTAEIAKYFPGVTALQEQRVLNFCQKELPLKISELSQSEEAYFEKERLWRLSVYDDKGIAFLYYFRIGGLNARCLEDISVEVSKAEDQGTPITLPLGWTTEIATAKLYAALELGESLTSLYIRINDAHFEAEIEQQISTVDVVEDPLIRILFSGSIGSYQEAQLRRIKATGRLRT